MEQILVPRLYGEESEIVDSFLEHVQIGYWKTRMAAVQVPQVDSWGSC